ncbi:GNAT family N-acetyltransferase [Chryseobacterium indologenes]|uniref:GNAT family N-acetyltransferase n=1 Tax=Chryseobacterium indologenes TaxID=253 RepID=UPI003017C834
MRIEKINHSIAEVQKRINYFLNILTGRSGNLSFEQLDAILKSSNTHLFFIFNEENTAVGMITLVIYNTCLGKKAWVEDVVIDNIYQGQGFGRMIMEFVIEFAKIEKVNILMLTSNSSRIAANSLYQKIGFKKKETNFYQIIF